MLSRGAYRVVELLRSEIVLLEKGGLLERDDENPRRE